MKKRVKLLTTIASLCLAVALMAFGVYAATTANMNITSSVAFTVNDVFVDVTYSASGALTVSETTVSSYTGTPKTFQALTDASFGDVTFDAEKTSVTYKVKITNKGTEAIFVALQDASTIKDASTGTAKKALQYTQGTEVAPVEIAAEGYKEIEVKIELLNFENTISAADNAVLIKVAAGKTAAECTFKAAE